MSNRPDWSKWILQKNNEAKEEALNKADNTSICTCSKDKENCSLHGSVHKADKETKHDRCARKVKESNPNIDNPHAVCIAAGVEPEKWKKSIDSHSDMNKATKDMAGDNVDSSMLHSELESLEHHIKEIREHLGEKEIAPDWVKAKVSKAASGLSDIAHYIMGLKEKK